MKFLQRLWISLVRAVFRFFAWTHIQVLEAEKESRANQAEHEWLGREDGRIKLIEQHLAKSERPVVRGARPEGNPNALPMNAKLNQENEIGSTYLKPIPPWPEKQEAPPAGEGVETPKDAA